MRLGCATRADIGTRLSFMADIVTSCASSHKMGQQGFAVFLHGCAVADSGHARGATRDRVWRNDWCARRPTPSAVIGAGVWRRVALPPVTRIGPTFEVPLLKVIYRLARDG